MEAGLGATKTRLEAGNKKPVQDGFWLLCNGTKKPLYGCVVYSVTPVCQVVCCSQVFATIQNLHKRLAGQLRDTVTTPERYSHPHGFLGESF